MNPIQIPKEIAHKAYEINKFFRENGHNCWAYGDLCSRNFIDAEVARITKIHKDERFAAEAREHKATHRLHRIWKELDPLFNSED